MRRPELFCVLGNITHEPERGKMAIESINGNGTIPEACPVCLSDDVQLAVAPCSHACCLPCFERIMSAPIPRRHDWSPALVPDEDEHLNVPTRGRCPICRCEVDLFDLQVSDKYGNFVPAPGTERIHDIASTGLKGLVFIPNRSQQGDRSVHFPTGESSDNSQSRLPYMDLSRMQDWKFANGERVPSKKYFEPDCYFHEPTRCFYGRLKWGDTCDYSLFGSLEWEVILVVSWNYQFISRGIMVHKRTTCQRPDCEKLSCKFPLDGRWSVTYPNGIENSISEYIVHNNVCSVQYLNTLSHATNQVGRIEFSEQRTPTITWSFSDRQSSEATITADSLQIGHSIEWKKSNLGSIHPSMIWTRKTVPSEKLPLQVLHIGPDHPSKLYYHLLPSGSSTRCRAEYHGEKVWGNTFCQALKVGLASYHFMGNSEAGAYISYEHEHTSVWPPLDNGNPIPTRIWFVETSFDATTRTFRGKIDWEGTHQTTWQGCRWWRYVE